MSLCLIVVVCLFTYVLSAADAVCVLFGFGVACCCLVLVVFKGVAVCLRCLRCCFFVGSLYVLWFVCLVVGVVELCVVVCGLLFVCY